MRKRPVIAVLERHYSRVRGELQAIAEEVVAAGLVGPALKARRAPEIEKRHALLASIQTCIRLEEPFWTPDAIAPRRERRPPEMAWGELLRIAYGVLQPTDRPLSSAEILQRLWYQGKLTEEQARSARIRGRLTELLRAEEARGAVRAIGERPARWLVRERGDPMTTRPRLMRRPAVPTPK